MAEKRAATSDINHENWTHEDPPEDSGTYQRASDEVLKMRVLKTARRRNPISSVRNTDDSAETKKSAFSSFTAFSKAPVPSSNAFSFLSNITPQPEQSKINGFPEKASTSKETTVLKTTPATKGVASPSGKTSDSYYSKLKGLNESVSKWIKKHVDENPLINLQPIFRDYERYFKEIESDKETAETKITETKKSDEVSSISTFVFKAAENIPDSTTEKVQQDAGKSSTGADPKLFSFGAKQSTSQEAPKATFSFGSNASSSTKNNFSFGSTASTSSAGFSFSSNASTLSKPSFSGSNSFSSFAGVPKPAPVESQTKEEDDEDAMPEEPQLPKVVETDHLYTTRCKVFVKKDGNFNVKGVGNLYIKSIENSQKVQVIVRADNNLGNLLCNFVLSENNPIKKVGSKDVMIVCLPTPDSQPPPVPLIIRVKSSEEAEKLLGVVEKQKK